MTAVRIIVSIEGPSAAEVDGVLEQRLRAAAEKSVEPGCLQYELYRSMANPERLLLIEHWSSRKFYDDHWTGQMEREGAPRRNAGWSSAVEIYPYQRYQLAGEIWVTVEETLLSETIRWA